MQFQDEPMENMMPKEIPSGLKTLCILTFVMCGLMILANLVGLKNFTATEEEIGQQYDMIQKFNPDMDMEFSEFVAQSKASAWNNLLSLVLNIGSLIGAIMMYKMQKKGFWLYTISEFLPYITMIFFGGNASKMGGGQFMQLTGISMQTLVIISMVVMVLIDGLFIFLYSRHLKSMQQ